MNRKIEQWTATITMWALLAVCAVVWWPGDAQAQTIGFTQSKFFGYERDANSMEICVTVSAPRSSWTSFRINATSNTATKGTDFTELNSGIWSVPPGSGIARICRSGSSQGGEIRLIDDDLTENSGIPDGYTSLSQCNPGVATDTQADDCTGEEFTLTIAPTTNGATADPVKGTATGIIVDDDKTLGLLVDGSVTKVIPEKAAAGALQSFTVYLSDNVFHTVTADIVAGTVLLGEDEYELVTPSVTIPAGQKSATAQVRFFDDNILEETELLRLSAHDRDYDSGSPLDADGNAIPAATLDLLIVNDPEDRAPIIGMVYSIVEPTPPCADYNARRPHCTPMAEEGEVIKVRAEVRERNRSVAAATVPFPVHLFVIDHSGGVYFDGASTPNNNGGFLTAMAEQDQTTSPFSYYAEFEIHTKRKPSLAARNKYMTLMPITSGSGRSVKQRYVVSAPMRVNMNDIDVNTPYVTVRAEQSKVTEGADGYATPAYFVFEAHTAVNDEARCRQYGAVGAVQVPCLIEGTERDLTVKFDVSGDGRLFVDDAGEKTITIKARNLAVRHNDPAAQTDVRHTVRIRDNRFLDGDTEGFTVAVKSGTGYTVYGSSAPSLPLHAGSVTVGIVDDEAITALPPFTVSLAPIPAMTEGESADVCVTTSRPVTEAEAALYNTRQGLSVDLNPLPGDDPAPIYFKDTRPALVFQGQQYPEYVSGEKASGIILAIVAGKTRHCLSDGQTRSSTVDPIARLYARDDGVPTIDRSWGLILQDPGQFTANDYVTNEILQLTLGTTERTVIVKDKTPILRYTVSWEADDDAAPRIAENGGTYDFTFRLERVLKAGEKYDIHFTNKYGVVGSSVTDCGKSCTSHSTAIHGAATGVTHTIVPARGRVSSKHKLTFSGAGAQEVTLRVTALDNNSQGIGKVQMNVVDPYRDVYSGDVASARAVTDRRPITDDPQGVVFFTDDDHTGTIVLGFTRPTTNVNENKGPAQPVIALSRPAAHDVKVRYRVQDVTAVLGVDYEITTGAKANVTERVVTIKLGDRTVETPVYMIDDGLNEGNETFEVILVSVESPSSGYEIYDSTTHTNALFPDLPNNVKNSKVTATILDNDPVDRDRPKVTLDIGDREVQESGQHIGPLWAYLDKLPPKLPTYPGEAFPELHTTTQLLVTTIEGTAWDGVDYVGVPRAFNITKPCNFHTTTVPDGFPGAGKPGCKIDGVIQLVNDTHDDDGETFQVQVEFAPGQHEQLRKNIAPGRGTVTITNDDPLPAAWLARFGRTVAEQALDGIAGRMTADRTPGMQGTIAGRALSFGPGASGQPTLGSATPGTTPASPEAALTMAGIARGLGADASAPAGPVSTTDPFGDHFGPPSPHAHSMSAREALLGSNFSLTGAQDASGGSLAFWGRASQNRFDGVERGDGTDIRLDGTVTTGMLGADYARGEWLMGLVLTQSASEGEYAALGGGPCPGTDASLCDGAVRAGDGKVEASLTAAIPYASVQASERLKLWGSAGYGAGEVTLKTAMGDRYEADTSWTMAAAGLRGDLLEAPMEGSGPALALTSDALWARTSSEKTRDLAASESDVTRLRLGLEGRYRLALAGDGHLTPKLEFGARHDGGDAETGFGVELGGGLAWSAPGLGLSLDVSGRTLLAHEDDDLEDRGVSAALAFDPAPATQRGLSLSLRQEFGGQASGGLDALFATAPLEDRAGSEAASRWTMEAAYGVPAFGGRFTGSPHAGFGLATGTRDWTLGWRLTPEGRTAPDLSFGVKAVRRESDAAPPEHTLGVELRAAW